jgi:Mn2+/Fe2+ NRAMP family transporter
VKRMFEIFLGVLTAFGGFVDMGDIVANAEAGARFKMSLAWAVVVGVIGIVLYAEMSGRIATISKRPVFDLVRERLGARAALVNLLASFLLNFLTLTAEIAGMAFVVQMITGVTYLAWLPVAALFVWFVIWRVRFSTLEKVFGLSGLLLIVIAVGVWKAQPGLHGLMSSALHPSVPSGEGLPTYLYFAIALLGAAMTPYEVFFFSSGAVEEKWTRKDLMVNRANAYIGFPLGGLLTLALMASAAIYFAPRHITVGNLAQAALPTSLSLGKIGLLLVLLGMFAAIASAALEVSLSAGYMVAQYFGWQWGKFVKPKDASRFHLVVILSIAATTIFALTTIDPLKVTELSLVLSAAALPLTYFPLLVIANDRRYMGNKVNSKAANVVATIYLILLIVAAAAAIPLMIVTKMGS